MTYCRVKIETTTRGQVYQKDFDPLNIFGPLVQVFVSALVTQAVIRQGEHYRALIFPRYTDTLNDTPMLIVDAAQAQEDYPAWLNVICAEDAPADDPITYFVLELRFPDSGVVFKQDLDILTLSHFWGNLQAALVKMHVLQEDDAYYPRLCIRDDGQQDFEREEVTIIAADDDDDLVLVEMVEKDERGPEFATKSASEFTVLATDEVELVSAATLDPAVLNGQQDVQIFITQDTFAALQAIARADVEVEQGGMLIGQVYHNAENAAQFIVEITDHVVSEETAANLVELRYTFESWARSTVQIKARFPGKRIVGWYHTHLIKTAVRSGETDDEIASTDLFFSGDDHFMHRQFFSDKWYVAMVLGQAGSAVFFRWFGDQISANQRFYIISAQ